MKLDSENLKKLANTIRFLSADGVQQANSGHPGLPMGTADFAAVLWANYLKFNPKDPNWIGRDRFVLSAGHGSMLLYSLLHLFGYEVSLADLKSFRQWESKTPGHPEFGITAGVECTTGPLGQGSANAVGLAMSSRMMAETYGSDLFKSRVFALVSDGDLMEGISAEASSLAGHLALDNLIYMYDDNKISLADPTKVCFTESVAKRYEGYGWFVQSVNGHDMDAVSAALDKAIANKGKPSLICCSTTIGFGSPNKANTSEVHGAPLGEDELKATKENLKWPLEPRFYIPKEVGEYCCKLMSEKVKIYDGWQSEFKGWEGKNAELSTKLKAQASREVPSALKDALVAAFKDQKKDATRNLSGKAIQVIAKHMPCFVGGAADLEPSTKTLIKDTTDIQAESFKGRNIRFGVREHGMGGIVNGLAYTRSWIPFGSTFLVFSDYLRPSVRLAAISHLQSLFIFTHDSFWVGEDGPTHEPIEHVASLRLIPNLYVYRPADGLEVAYAYYSALSQKNAPSVLIFTRQNLPPIERAAGFNNDDLLKGGYLVSGADAKDVAIVATGSELTLAVEAAKLLKAENVSARVISMPCMELFLKQDQKYREALLPKGMKAVSIEAGVTTGWERIVGSGLKIGLDHYGASAPGEVIAEKFGFTPAKIKEKIKGWL